MKVIEIIKNFRQHWGTEIEVSGEAHVSSSMAVIYDKNECEFENCIYPGILIHGDRLENIIRSLPKSIPIYAGSEIAYVVDVVIKGVVENTGYKFAPLKFVRIYEITVSDKYSGRQHLKVEDYLKDIEIVAKSPIKASAVKLLEPYFDGFGSLVELKKHIESGNRVKFRSRVPESHIDKYIVLLGDLGLEFFIEDSPIDGNMYDWPV